MAGAGRKVFTPGEILRAADVNGFLMDQAVQVFDDATERDLALGTAVVSQGMVSYLADSDSLEYYSGADSWQYVAGTATSSAALAQAQNNLGIKVLQVQQTLRTTAFSASTAGNSFTSDVIDVKITPSAVSSKILVEVALNLTADNNRLSFLLKRDGAASVFVGDAAGSRTRLTGGASVQTLITPSAVSFVGLDSPATTSEVTYSVSLYNNSSSTALMQMNRSTTDTDNASFGRYPSTITVTEIAG
jgi:hypothetical protein